MTLVFLDADVVIGVLRANPKAQQLLRGLVSAPDTELCMSVLQRSEVLFHLRPGEEVRTVDLLDSFRQYPVTQEVVDFAAPLFRRWNPSHGTGRNDALLAATVLIEGGRLVTQNLRHFPMPELHAERGWEE